MRGAGGCAEVGRMLQLCACCRGGRGAPGLHARLGPGLSFGTCVSATDVASGLWGLSLKPGSVPWASGWTGAAVGVRRPGSKGFCLARGRALSRGPANYCPLL